MVANSLNQTDEYNTTIEQQRNVAPCQGMPNYGFEPLDSSLPYFVNAALNVPLAVATTFANLVVLLAMRQVTSIRLPSKLLLCSLVLTDLGAGSVVQPQFVALLFSEAIYPDHEQCALLKSFLFTGSLFGLSSFFTLTSIVLDRYAALFSHFNYQQIATTRRICVVIVVVWLLAIFVASTLFWSYELWSGLVTAVGVINLPLISLVLTKIHRRLRILQIHPPAPNEDHVQPAGNTLNMRMYRRVASAMILIHLLLLFCYTPYLGAAIATVALGETALILCLERFAYTIVLLNSLLNPFVYCFRLPEIRTEIIKTLRRLCCRRVPE